MTNEEYERAVKGAFDFAGPEGEAWNGLFLLGLAIAGLKLIDIEPGTKLPKDRRRPPPPWANGGANSEDWSPYAIMVEHDFDESQLNNNTVYD